LVTQEQLTAALDPQARQEWSSWRAEIQRLTAERAALGESSTEAQPWNDLAQSILNLKEFIYVR
jgi:hypothetical protein